MDVKIKTPSRIHLGLIDLNGELGRLYGSIGLALNEPSIVLEAKRADSLKIGGQDTERVRSLVQRFAEAYNISEEVEIFVKQTIPEHTGFGSGTQLALAVASALSHLHKLSVGVRDLAASMGRGAISGIGVESFRKGGFIVDSGRKKDFFGDIPFAIQRIPVPADWSFVLAIPPSGRGLSGELEESAFKKIVPASAEIAKSICRLLQMKMLPALMEKDIEAFGESLMEVDRNVGLYFKEVQDGIYKEPVTQEIIDLMLDSGSHGAGQSSWGPAVYCLVEDHKAKNLESTVKSFFEEKDLDATVIRTHANNSGAAVSVVEDDV